MTNRRITLTYDRFITPTPRAFLVTFGENKVWLPQNQTEIDEKTKTLTVPFWLAAEKEIEAYEE